GKGEPPARLGGRSGHPDHSGWGHVALPAFQPGRSVSALCRLCLAAPHGTRGDHLLVRSPRADAASRGSRPLIPPLVYDELSVSFDNPATDPLGHNPVEGKLYCGRDAIELQFKTK